MRKVIDDLFDLNPRYKATKAKAVDVMPPLSYDVIRKLQPQNQRDNKKPRPSNLKRRILQFPQLITPRTIFNKKGLESEADFLVKDIGRKNHIVAGQKLKEFNQRQQSIRENSKGVGWLTTHEDELIKYIQLLTYIPTDCLLAIRDYALSEYVYCCQSNNQHFKRYLQSLIQHQLIEYGIKPIHVLSRHSMTEDEEVLKVDIEDIMSVTKYIDDLNQSNKKSDPFYCGLHLFMGLQDLPVVAEDQDYTEQEGRFAKYLQYYITMISGLLGEGQVAIIKLYSSIGQKTNQYIFMLRWMFYKLSIVKPMLSNHLNHEKFIICQGYRKATGDKIHKFLVENYGLLKQFGDNKLLVKTEVIGKTEYNTLMTDYNNKIINYEFKTLNNALSDNPNTLYLPHEQFLTGKLKGVFDSSGYVQKMMNKIFEEKLLIQEQNMREEQTKRETKTKESQNQDEGRGINLLSLMGVRRNKSVPQPL